MKTTSKLLVGVLALGCSALMLTAQKGPDGGQDGPPLRDGGPNEHQGPGPGRRHRPPPIIAALDANHDGVIDESEIANASAALRTLDKNGDGELTMDELMGPPPPRGERPAPPDGPASDGPPQAPPQSN
jgi:hypothetical protein